MIVKLIKYVSHAIISNDAKTFSRMTLGTDDIQHNDTQY